MPCASSKKLSLTDPKRTTAILAHREKRKNAMTADPTPNVKHGTSGTRFYKMMGESTSLRNARFHNGQPMIKIDDLDGCLGAMTIRPMRDLMSKLFKDLTIIEEPYVENELCIGDFPAPKNFLVETLNKEVCTLQVQGLPDNENTLEMFVVGTRIDLLNASVASDSTGWGEELKNVYFIVDERMEQKIYPIKRIIDMCRYCGAENAKKQCTSCKVPYCNRECQLADWKILKHKRVCQAGSSESRFATSSDEVTGLSEFANLKLNKGSKMPRRPTVKSNLTDPARISRILSFRAKYNFMFKKRILSPQRDRFVTFKFMGDLVQEMKERNPKPIVLKDMECSKIYENNIIELMIIEEPLTGFSYAHFLCEDKNKDITLVAVNGLFHLGNDAGMDAEQRLLFRAGATFCVVHPFYKLGDGDGLPMIRVDHLPTIKPFLRIEGNCDINRKSVVLGMTPEVCSYCGEKNAKRKCSACKRLYCGEECEALDKEVLKHKLVCETGPIPMTHWK